MTDGAVLRLGVWHIAQPTIPNRRLPLAMDAAPPGLLVDGVGGASRRMNIANCTTSLGTAGNCVEIKLVVSSGVGFSLQLAGRPPLRASSGLARSFWKSSLVTPISTL